MRKIGYKSVRLAVAAVGAVVLAAPVPALASPAAAAQAGAATAASAPGFASVAVAPRPRPLTGALLTTNDLPAGYQTMTGGSGMSMMGDINTDADICDQHIGTSAGVHRGRTAAAAFAKNGLGTMLFESITSTGPRAALDIVDGVAIAPHQCPTVLTNVPASGQAIRLRLTPLRVARMGDAAAGVAFTAKLPAVGMTVQGKMIAVAYRGTALTIMLIGTAPVTPQEANAIAITAARKLQRLH
ncbi:hypothetical protein [Actinoplanes sp. NPDC026619]|uniref:hypothetical protein n=1 Tax=Actinoplanes sp. NPDC026619 TaxID=3155798 RepID=UPI0034104E57